MNELIETTDLKIKETEAQGPLHPLNTDIASTIFPQAGCSTCGSKDAPGNSVINSSGKASYVYAIGRVEARFPNLAAEKEFAQATGRMDTAGKTDQQTFHAVLSDSANRYLVRQLCWVLSIQGLDTYLLLPRDASDVNLLVEAIRPSANVYDNDIDVVIGILGPVAPPEMCNGLMVPIVVFDTYIRLIKIALSLLYLSRRRLLPLNLGLLQKNSLVASCK